MHRYLYILLGLLCFGLGALGAMLPILPTTPFLLLAGFFFLRSSQRLHSWFLETKLYRKYLAGYAQERALTLRTKLLLLSITSAMLAIPFIIVDKLYLRCILLAVFGLKIWYFSCKIKTAKPTLSAAQDESVRRQA